MCYVFRLSTYLQQYTYLCNIVTGMTFTGTTFSRIAKGAYVFFSRLACKKFNFPMWLCSPTAAQHTKKPGPYRPFTLCCVLVLLLLESS